MTKDLTLISWNVNGIRSVVRKGVFQPFIDQYHPDILCLQETKALQGQAEIDLPEYEEYWNSAEKKGYSGTAIFTKHIPISIANGFPKDIAKRYDLVDGEDRNSESEGRIIAAEYEKFYVVTVYTPNSKEDLSRLDLRHKHWDPAFLAYMKELEKKRPVLFCGDLNVAHGPDDLAQPEKNEGKHGYTVEEREGVTRMIEAGFVDTFRIFHQGNGHYSWWSHWANARARNIGWRLDYWFASTSLKPAIKDSFILPKVVGSDHSPVGLNLTL